VAVGGNQLPSMLFSSVGGGICPKKIKGPDGGGNLRAPTVVAVDGGGNQLPTMLLSSFCGGICQKKFKGPDGGGGSGGFSPIIIPTQP
jgi:hypothetical protein